MTKALNRKNLAYELYNQSLDCCDLKQVMSIANRTTCIHFLMVLCNSFAHSYMHVQEYFNCNLILFHKMNVKCQIPSGMQDTVHFPFPHLKHTHTHAQVQSCATEGCVQKPFFSKGVLNFKGS